MKISVPEARAYYPASKNEPEYLLCWIPAVELAQLVDQGRVSRDILDDYPGGLEVEVSASAFEDVELDLGVSPEALRRAYGSLLEQKRHGDTRALPESGRVDGAWLEEKARATESGLMSFDTLLLDLAAGETPPQPKMSDGQDARTVMQNL
jgi:hypothetical protein